MLDLETRHPGHGHALREPFRVGEEVAGFRIDELLGRGASAVVYGATAIETGEQRALKVLLYDGHTLRQRFRTEGRLQASLVHANILPLRGTLEIKGHPVLVLDWVLGQSLDVWIRTHSLSLEQTLEYFIGIVRGVEAAHQKGVIHRDIKPPNILMDMSSGRLVARVGDFGVARLLGGPLGQTATGDWVGSPGYMAPEQFLDVRAVDERADVFSLGCVLYEIMCGMRPFDGWDTDSLITQITRGEFEDPMAVRPEIPPEVAEAIRGCLVADPAVRIGDCTELLQVLTGRPLLSISAPQDSAAFVVVTWSRIEHDVRVEPLSGLRSALVDLRRQARGIGGYVVQGRGPTMEVAFSTRGCALSWCNSLGFAMDASGEAIAMRAGVAWGRIQTRRSSQALSASFEGRVAVVARRLVACAHPGQILSTRSLIDDESYGETVQWQGLGTHEVEPGRPPLALVQVAPVDCPSRSFPPLRLGSSRSISPFLGLRAYRETDCSLFFGRRAEVERLLRRLAQHPVVTVIGPSGVGKSSLLRAGIGPALDEACVVYFRPGLRPLSALRRSLEDALSPWSCGQDFQSVLENDPSSLGRCLEPWAAEQGQFLILVVDQAEELLAEGLDPTEVDRCIVAAVSLGRSVVAPTRLVVAVREDFFGPLARVSALQGHLTACVEQILPPKKDALREMIELPLAIHDVAFEDPDVLTQIVSELEQEPASLALLQSCMEPLWARRDVQRGLLLTEEYETMGGVLGALASHAEAVYLGLASEQRQETRRIFLRLVRPEGTRTLVEPRSLFDSSSDEELTRIVLARLVEARLLRVGGDEDLPSRLEVVHEALGPHWLRLDRWLSEDREGHRIHHELSRAAAEWGQHNESAAYLWERERWLELSIHLSRSEWELTTRELRFVRCCERAATAARRRRFRTLSLLSVAFLMLAGGLGIALSSSQEARRRLAQESIQTSLQVLLLRKEQAQARLQLGESVALLRAALTLMDSVEEPDPLIRQTLVQELGISLLKSPSVIVLPETPGAIRSAVFSADSALLAVASSEQMLRVFDIGTGEQMFAHAVEGSVHEMVFTTGNSCIDVLSFDDKTPEVSIVARYCLQGQDERSVRIPDIFPWNSLMMPSGRTAIVDEDRVVVIQHDGAVNLEFATAYGEYGRDYAANDSICTFGDGQLVLLEVHRTEGRYTLHLLYSDGTYSQGSCALPATPDGVLCSRDGEDGVWLYGEGYVSDVSISDFTCSTTKFVDGFVESPVSASIDVATESIMLLDADGGLVARNLSGEGGVEWSAGEELLDPKELRRSPDGALLLTINESGPTLFSLFDARTGVKVGRLDGDYSAYRTIDFSPDSTHLVIGSYDGVVRLWSLDHWSGPEVLFNTEGNVWNVKPFGDMVAIVASDDAGFVYSWSEKHGYKKVLVPAPPGLFLCGVSGIVGEERIGVVAKGSCQEPQQVGTTRTYSEPGVNLVIGSFSTDLTPESWLEIVSLEVADIGGGMEFAPSGRVVATSHQDGCIRVWSTLTPQEPQALCWDGRSLETLTWSADEKWIAAASVFPGDPIAIFNVQTGMLQAVLEVPDRVMGLAFSNDSQSVVASTANGLSTWSVSDGRLVGEYVMPDIYGEPRPGLPEKTVGVPTWGGVFVQVDAEKNSSVDWLMGNSPLCRSYFDEVGQRVAVMSSSGLIFVLDLTNRAQPIQLPVYADGCGGVVIAGDDAFAGLDLDLRLRRVDTTKRGAVVRVPLEVRPRHALVEQAGMFTNLRICRDTFEPVAVIPIPDTKTVWAPEELCASVADSNVE